jgi:hypothetical protein
MNNRMANSKYKFQNRIRNLDEMLFDCFPLVIGKRNYFVAAKIDNGQIKNQAAIGNVMREITP